MTFPLASVVITSYNQESFLRHALDSALAQTHPRTEVVVVDDGSTDSSPAIVADYGDRVAAVLKENGGETSAVNAGFFQSRGDVVMFLDGDDTLLPGAVERSIEAFAEPGVVKVHWPLREIDHRGEATGVVNPRGQLPEGDLRDELVRMGPDAFHSPPTSGNIFARRALERIFPVTEPDDAPALEIGCADAYLSTLAPLFGRVKRLLEPQGTYRRHAANHYAGKPFDVRLRHDLAWHRHCCRALSRWCGELGLPADPERWESDSWVHHLRSVADDIVDHVPPDSDFILVDGWNWDIDTIAGRRAINLMERSGLNWGAPPDDATAIRELELMRRSGARFIVIGSSCYWFLDCYPGFREHLGRFCCVLENDRLVMFDLRDQRVSAGSAA
jgi:glycosyltransferase involved in cell wall biosynthesis